MEKGCVEVAICLACKKEIVGKIYENCVCADCKIHDLQAKITRLEDETMRLAEKYDKEWRSKGEYSSKYLRYKSAFEVLIETLKQ